MSGLENRPTQTQQIVDLLRSRKGQWVPLPEILALKISQYGARVYQARHELGLTIENRKERANGEVHTWFRLVENEPIAPPATTDAATHATSSLFGDLHSQRSAFDVQGGR